MLADFQLFEISFISTRALEQHAKHERYRKQHMYPGGNQNLTLYLSDSAFQNARRLVRHEELWCISYLFCLAVLFKKKLTAGPPPHMSASPSACLLEVKLNLFMPVVGWIFL